MTVEEAYNYLTSPSYCTIDCDNCNNCCDDCDVNASLNLAVKALEKQIPKVTIEGDEHDKCPVCNSDVLPFLQNFCEFCGQAITTEWSKKWEHS